MKKEDKRIFIICGIAIVILIVLIVYEGVKDKNKLTQTENTHSTQYVTNEEYQVFEEFQFKVKCHATLEDVSNRSNDDFDFNYAGSSDDTFYQVMIVKIPAGRLDLTREEENEFLIEMFENKGGGKSVLWGDDSYPAYLLNDYTQEGHRGRSIAVARKGKIYVFNVITKGDLDARFNSFTNNVIFINNNEETNSSHDKVEKGLYNPTKYAIAIINYKESYQKIKVSPFSEEEKESYRLIWDISKVLEVPSNISEDDKQRLLDGRFENKIAPIGVNILIDKELYLFNTYSEASNFMVERRKLHYE